uniref:Uncharacterized protein n=1 Tax=Megaselia scalaris TaxID=36166 RepID=T1GKL9_MEGSC
MIYDELKIKTVQFLPLICNHLYSRVSEVNDKFVSSYEKKKKISVSPPLRSYPSL